MLGEPDEIHMLAMLGLVLLLFHLGIEFSVDELISGGRRLLWAGGAYIALNFGAGLVLGWALGWGTREIFVIAGMIGTSSTAIVTKLILDLRRVNNRETGMILGIIVVEDVFLAFYLALLQPILGDSGRRRRDRPLGRRSPSASCSGCSRWRAGARGWCSRSSPPATPS